MEMKVSASFCNAILDEALGCEERGGLVCDDAIYYSGRFYLYRVAKLIWKAVVSLHRESYRLY